MIEFGPSQLKENVEKISDDEKSLPILSRGNSIINEKDKQNQIQFQGQTTHDLKKYLQPDL